ncbi:hypothetical protein HYZ64_00280 [Candidatus Berkelbacteria bacterium]|nr:hypothetical protein [Candidatus Berkelbacteria bacterium]
MKNLVICLLLAAGSLPQFKPIKSRQVVSPDGAWVAKTVADSEKRGRTEFSWQSIWITSLRLPTATDPLFRCRYDGIDIDNGVRHFGWSPDSSKVVFDFIRNRGAKNSIGRASYIGFADIETGAGWILRDLGCEPRFKNATTIEFLSFSERLESGAKGAPACILEGDILYRHAVKLGKPFAKLYVISPGRVFNFSLLEYEFEKH